MKNIVMALALTGCAHVYAQEHESPHQFFLTQQAAPATTTKGYKGPTKSVTGNSTPLPPSKYILGRLTCALNVNRALEAVGIRGTGSARALDFLKWGSPSHKQPGAVQVSRRKGKGNGHVELVASNGQCWNPSSSRSRWVLVPCDSRRNVIGWRVA